MRHNRSEMLPNNVGPTTVAFIFLNTSLVVHVDSLPYVEATILEVLRYKTLAALGLAHCTSKDTEVDGCFIPKQTTVSSRSLELY